LFELLYGPAEEPASFGATDLNAPLLMEVRDDSMEPTIAKGDLLLADRSFGMRPSALERSRTERRSCAFTREVPCSRSIPGSNASQSLEPAKRCRVRSED
jgi:hypothetical protein